MLFLFLFFSVVHNAGEATCRKSQLVGTSMEDARERASHIIQSCYTVKGGICYRAPRASLLVPVLAWNS